MRTGILIGIHIHMCIHIRIMSVSFLQRSDLVPIVLCIRAVPLRSSSLKYFYSLYIPDCTSKIVSRLSLLSETDFYSGNGLRDPGE